MTKSGKEVDRMELFSTGVSERKKLETHRNDCKNQEARGFQRHFLAHEHH